MQYIAILQISNTIQCNTSDQQYIILQYFRTTIQYCNTFNHTIYYIGNNILQYNVIQYIVVQPCHRVLVLVLDYLEGPAICGKLRMREYTHRPEEKSFLFHAWLTENQICPRRKVKSGIGVQRSPTVHVNRVRGR